MWSFHTADPPQTAGACPLTDRAALRRNMNDPKIDNIKVAIRPKLAMRRALKSIMGQLGGGSGHFVDRKITDLTCSHIQPDDFVACRCNGFGQRGDRCQVAEAGYEGIALESEVGVSAEIKPIGSHMGLEGCKRLGRIGVGKFRQHRLASMTAL